MKIYYWSNFSDSDCEDILTDTKVDKSKYNCPYYNGYNNDEEITEYAIMEPETSKNVLSNILVKNDSDVVNLDPYQKSHKLLSKWYLPVTIAILHRSSPILNNLLQIDCAPNSELIDIENQQNSSELVKFGRINLVAYIVKISQDRCTVTINDHTNIKQCILLEDQMLRVGEYYDIFAKISEKGYIVIEYINHI